MVGTRNSPPRAPRSLIAQAFGDVLEGARKRRDLSAEQVAARARISIARLSAIEHARIKPRLDQLYRVADALGVSRMWLIDEVIDWLAPHTNLPHDAVAGGQITDQEVRFIHQLIFGVHAPTRRSTV
jgi:transcriptional regulator with XRE-family HTH domain